MSTLSKSISNSSIDTIQSTHNLISSNTVPISNARSRSRFNSFSNENRKDSDSLIFERNVEDPYLQKTSRSVSRPISRRQSQATLMTLNNDSITHFNNIHKPYISKTQSNHSFSGPSYDLRRYSTNPNNSFNNNFLTNTTTSRVTTGSNNQLYSIANNSNENYLFYEKHNLENFVPPALDESCLIVTDANTKLDDVDMIYSKRPSTIGLDRALGRTASSSLVTNNANYTNTSNHAGYDVHHPNHSRARTYHPDDCATSPFSKQSSNDLSTPLSQPTRLLRFYSYVDMLSDEKMLQPQPQQNHQLQSNSQARPELFNHNSFSNDEKFDNRQSCKKSSTIKSSPSRSPTSSSESETSSTTSFFTNPFMRNKRDSVSNSKFTRDKGSNTFKMLRTKFHLHSNNSSNHCDEDVEYNEHESPDDPIAKSNNSNDNRFILDFNYDDINDRLQQEKASDILKRRVNEKN